MTQINTTDTHLITFIGAGNMAASLIAGLCSEGYPPNRIRAADPNQAALDKLNADFDIQVDTDNLTALEGAGVVVFAVKPQIMATVVSAIAPKIEVTVPLLVSVAAGITTNNFDTWLRPGLPIIRTMPNTPALIRMGATGLYANDEVSKSQRELAEKIFGAVGITLWFNAEADLDKVVALSGSGPAYFFLLMEAMQKVGEKMGLSQEAARLLTLQTGVGATQLARNEGVEFAELRRRVTSPGGTTERAIEHLQNGQFETLIEEALLAAQARSKELAS